MCVVLAEYLSAEHEVFINYYSQIVCCVSAKSLCRYFVAENIILLEDSEEICAVSSDIKVAGLLLSKIYAALKAEINEIFYKFLDIVEQHDKSESKIIITSIRKKLSELKSAVKGDY